MLSSDIEIFISISIGGSKRDRNMIIPLTEMLLFLYLDQIMDFSSNVKKLQSFPATASIITSWRTFRPVKMIGFTRIKYYWKQKNFWLFLYRCRCARISCEACVTETTALTLTSKWAIAPISAEISCVDIVHTVVRWVSGNKMVVCFSLHTICLHSVCHHWKIIGIDKIGYLACVLQRLSCLVL